MKSYKELFAWQKAIELTVSIYSLTRQFPKSELFGLVSQMRRSAVSIPSNIAEGYYRYNKKEYRHFCSIALGSASELETQLLLAKRLDMAELDAFTTADSALLDVLRLLNKLTQSIA